MNRTVSTCLVLALCGLAPGAAAQTLLFACEGLRPGDAHCGVVPAGDVNGDGHADFLVSAPLALGASGQRVGTVTLYSGIDGAVLWHVEGTHARGLFGATLAAGDTDGNGTLDVVVGIPRADVSAKNAGRVEIYAYPATTPSVVRDGAKAGDRFGDFLALAEDLDGDGGRDVLIGLPRWTNAGGQELGRVRALSGATLNAIWSRNGAIPDTCFGDALAGLSDLDGDSVGDVLVGALDGDAAHLLSGATGTPFHTWTGDFGSCFGTAVADAGDVDGDGVRDVIVGAHCDDTIFGTQTGSATVFSGASPFSALHFFAGTDAFGYFGDDVTGAGDVDGDGFADLLVGAWGDDSAATDAGRAVVYSGSTGGVLLEVFGARAGDELGVPVAGLGDVDGDGRDDVGVGACFHDRTVTFGGTNQLVRLGDHGAAFVYGR